MESLAWAAFCISSATGHRYPWRSKNTYAIPAQTLNANTLIRICRNMFLKTIFINCQLSIVASPMSPQNAVLRSECTGFAFRIEHRKWNRGRNRLPKLVQTIAPSVPFPVFNPEGEPSRERKRAWSVTGMGKLLLKRNLVPV